MVHMIKREKTTSKHEILFSFLYTKCVPKNGTLTSGIKNIFHFQEGVYTNEPLFFSADTATLGVVEGI